jgi:lipopolysaccharide export system permease protein
LRFLELVIGAGASGTTFWVLTFLALPRFFEVILPIALMASTVFIYNKMTMDSEIVVMRQAGLSPMALARPALMVSVIMTLVLWMVTMWFGPLSLSSMHNMRQIVKSQYSTLLFREGVFNSIIPGLTVFIRDKDSNGELRGIVIQDNRENNEMPVTVLAKRGVVVMDDERQQVLVYDGSRQSLNPKTGVLDRLDFERYSIDLPEGSSPVRQRWREPDERTFLELLNPDPDNQRDVENEWEFVVEAHRRVISPLLAPGFVLIALSLLLLGQASRRGQGWRIAATILATIIIQGLYLAAFNLARQSGWGLVLMYILVLLPIFAGLFMLSKKSERFRRSLLFGRELGRRQT